MLHYIKYSAFNQHLKGLKFEINGEEEKAINRVKSVTLVTGRNLESYLTQKYASYQTSWNATLLSGKNFCVHFNARKIRQEPIVYSFSIDLDNNGISGLNNLGMDLLLKGE